MITAFTQHLVDRLRHRRGLPLALRGVERTQHRLLGRKTCAADILRALRPHRPRHQKSQQSYPRRRPPPPRKPLGSRPSCNTANKTTSRSTSSALTSTPTTPPKTSSAPTNKFPATVWSCPFCRKGPRRDHILSIPQGAPHLQRIQRQLLQRTRRHRQASTWDHGSPEPSASATASPRQ